MRNTIGELSTAEFETLVERTIDRRLAVWLTQLTDALTMLPESDPEYFQPEFEVSMQRALQQAQAGDTIDLAAFRQRLGQ